MDQIDYENQEEDGDNQKKIENEDDKPEEEDEESLRVKEQIQKFQDDIKAGLSNPTKVADCYSLSYTKLTINDKEIEKLYKPILNYEHIRYLDISGNQIKDIQLLIGLKFLIFLNASRNLIPSIAVFNRVADEEILPFLQVLYLSGNKIKKLENVSLPNLKTLLINENEITSADGFNGHPTLQILELKQNKLQSMKGLQNMPNLKELNLEENEITKFKQLKGLDKLENLVLSKNKIKQLKAPLPYLPSLNNLSLSENEINNFMQLLSLNQYPTLFSLSVLGNPLDVEDPKIEILIFMNYFKRINDQEITIDDRKDAEFNLSERILEADRQRKEAEEQYRLQQLQEQQEDQQQEQQIPNYQNEENQ